VTVTWLLEPLQHVFMIRALVAGMLMGGVCAALGVFVVHRGLSFIGDGLSHACFGGLALGLMLGFGTDQLSFVAIPFTVLVGLAIMNVVRRRSLSGDVATGVLAAVSFALGVLLLGLRRADRGPIVNVETLLFGSILAVSEKDLWIIVALAIFTAAVLVGGWGKFAYATFDPDLAALSGVPVRLLDYLLMGLASVVIVVAVKTVGVALVSSFVILPAATARLLGRTLARITVIAVALGVSSAALGLYASYHLDVASGATIILTLGVAFAASWAFGRK
jgi:zinc transport system permease protein